VSVDVMQSTLQVHRTLRALTLSRSVFNTVA
jgi:hypothetical protein